MLFDKLLWRCWKFGWVICIFCEYNFHPQISASNCGKLQKYGIRSTIYSKLFQPVQNILKHILVTHLKMHTACRQQDVRASWNSNYFELMAYHLKRTSKAWVIDLLQAREYSCIDSAGFRTQDLSCVRWAWTQRNRNCQRVAQHINGPTKPYNQN